MGSLPSFSYIYSFASGGPTIILLAIALLLSCILTLERLIYFHTKKLSLEKTLELIQLIAVAFKNKRRIKKPTLLQNTRSLAPVEYVLRSCGEYVVSQKKSISLERYFEEAKNRFIAEKLPEIEKYLLTQATLGTISPYVGLLGTVFGIIQAFSAMGSSLDATPYELNAGIAKALTATAAGLLVAIPSSISYNYFRKKAQSMIREIEINASLLKTTLFHSEKPPSNI